MNRRFAWAFVAMYFGAAGSPAAEPKNASKEEFFQTAKVWAIHLTIPAEEYKGMQLPNMGFGFFPGGPMNPQPKKPDGGREVHRNAFGVDIPKAFGAFESGGQSIDKIGIRYKGNGSLRDSMRVTKKSFKIELDKYDSKVRFHELKTLNLNNGITDPTKARETLSYAAYRNAGVPAPRTTLAEVSLTVPDKFDKEYLGLYTIIEPLDKPFLKKHFNDDKGLLMKPERTGGLNYMGDDWDKYKANYQPKRDATPEEAKRVIEFLKLINQGSDEQFRKEIDAILDVDGFLRFMAVTSMIANMDSFFTLGHNFDLYLNSKTKKFHFIPWDVDRAFANFPIMGNAEQQMDLSLTKPYSQCRLPDRLLAMPAYAEKYKQILKEAAATFTKEKLTKQIEEFEAATKEILARDAKAAAGRKEATVGGQFGRIPELRAFVEKRTASIAAQLEGKSKGYSPVPFGPPGGGFGGGPGGPGGQLGALLPAPLQDALKLTEEQKKQIAELQKEADSKLDKILTDEQRAAYKRMRGGPGGPQPMPPMRP